MSEELDDLDTDVPDRYECGECGAYWFEYPGQCCNCCGSGDVYAVYADEQDFIDWPGHTEPKA